jgi:hypothetical protein
MNCPTCDRPVADAIQRGLHLASCDGAGCGYRPDLCWGGPQCEARRVDWRKRHSSAMDALISHDRDLAAARERIGELEKRARYLEEAGIEAQAERDAARRETEELRAKLEEAGKLGHEAVNIARAQAARAERLEAFVGDFAHVAGLAVDSWEPSKGMRAPYHGDFASGSVAPSVKASLREWLERARKVLKP